MDDVVRHVVTEPEITDIRREAGEEEMDRQRSTEGIATVATCTAAAAHRRDHDHPTNQDSCHPHAVEVIYLGTRAVAVCHDCRSDTGFLPHRQAERIALAHHEATGATGLASVPAAAA